MRSVLVTLGLLMIVTYASPLVVGSCMRENMCLQIVFVRMRLPTPVCIACVTAPDACAQHLVLTAFNVSPCKVYAIAFTALSKETFHAELCVPHSIEQEYQFAQTYFRDVPVPWCEFDTKNVHLSHRE